MGSTAALEAETGAPAVPRRLTPTAPTLAAILVTLGGVGVRVWALTSTAQRAFNGDEAVTGVMVRTDPGR